MRFLIFSIVILPLVLFSQEGVDDISNCGDYISPEFPGGIENMYKFIADNFEVPKGGEVKATGKVHISFIVESNGEILNVKVDKGINRFYDSALVEVIRKMPRWEPAKENGRNIRVKQSIPIPIKFSD